MSTVLASAVGRSLLAAWLLGSLSFSHTHTVSLTRFCHLEGHPRLMAACHSWSQNTNLSLMKSWDPASWTQTGNSVLIRGLWPHIVVNPRLRKATHTETLQ